MGDTVVSPVTAVIKEIITFMLRIKVFNTVIHTINCLILGLKFFIKGFLSKCYEKKFMRKIRPEPRLRKCGALLTVKLTHCPTEELHPTMHDSSQEWERMCAPFRMVQRFILTPSSRTTPAPIVTLGPMAQFSPITAVGSWLRLQYVIHF